MDEQQIFRWSELNYVCLLRRLGRDALLILLGGVIAVLGVLLVAVVHHTDEYTASATLAVNVKSSSYSGIYSDLSVSSEIADTFTQLFESNVFAEVAASQLGVTRLPGQLTATVIPQTNLLTLRVTADDPLDAFDTLQIMLDNYDTVSEHVFQNVVLKELNAPTVPTAPSNPIDVPHRCERAFVVGVVVMAAIVAAASALSDTVQTTAAFRRKIAADLFATVHHEEKNKTLRTRLRRANRGLLVTMPVASFRFTEEIGKLAVKLGYAAGDAPGGRVVLITSTAENEGKSTVAANLALALAQSGQRVLLIDADLHKAAQWRLLSHRPQTELLSVLEGKAEAAPEHLDRYGLDVLLSTRSSTAAAELLGTDRAAALLARARVGWDYVVVDSPPMAMFSDVEALADRADLSLLVVRQDTVPAQVINDMGDALGQCRARFLGCVFNDVRSMPLTNDHYGYGYGYGGYGHGYGRGYGAPDRKRNGAGGGSDGRA